MVYEHYVSEADADETVTTYSGLASALTSAPAGYVIFVDGASDIEIATDSDRLIVPSGVTVASNRNDGSGGTGGRLWTEATWGFGAEGMLQLESFARLTGLRLEGPIDDADTDDGWLNYDGTYEMSGVEALGLYCEVDNCEIYRFGHSQVHAGWKCHVHDNHLHHANMEGLGYGVFPDNVQGPPLIEDNSFDYVRHAVADGGNGSYTFRNNVIDGPAIGHLIDVHEGSAGAGYRTEIYGNDVRVDTDDQDGSQLPGVAIRGTPVVYAHIHGNRFKNPEPPVEPPSNAWTDEAIIQPKASTWENVEYPGNEYGVTF